MTTIVLILLLLAALWTVMTRSLLRAAIGLAFTSAALTIAMFWLDSPMAAVFELSVCAGLISVIFISTISLTQPLTKEEVIKHMKDRLTRYWHLPLIIAVAGIILSLITIKINFCLPPAETEKDVRVVIWGLRHLDLIGMLIILLSGVLGVAVLFKETQKK